MPLDNLIFIKGGAYSDVKKALQQWIDLYSNDLSSGLTFELFKLGRGKHMIQVDKRLDNERFFYLINYLNYPENIHYKIEIEGFTTGKLDNKLLNKNLLIYIPPTDNEFDNVYISTSENKHFKFDFGGRISEINEGRNYQIPDSKCDEKPEIIEVIKNKLVQTEVSNNNSTTKFKQFSTIAGLVLVITLFISFFDVKTFVDITYCYGIGLGVWLYIDYPLLQSDKHYFYCLIFSIVFIGYALFLKNQLNTRSFEILDLGAFYPFALLIIQWPTRRIYLAIFKREPKVDRYGKTADVIYTIILSMGLGLLPIIMIDSLKS